MRTKIVKWGNSLGLRIPRSFAEEVRVADGTAVDLTLEDGRLVIRPLPGGAWTLDGMLADVTAENLHAEIDTGDAMGRESW